MAYVFLGAILLRYSIPSKKMKATKRKIHELNGRS